MNKDENKKLRLSVSAIGAYENCPKQYYYRYIEKLKVDKVPNIATEFGSLMHLILELFHDKIIKNNSSELDYNLLMTESVNEAVKEFDIPLVKQGVWTPNGTKPGLDYMVSLCKEYLKQIKDGDLPNVVGIEEKFEFFHKNIKMVGYIDRIDKVDENTYKVIDYKTSKNFKYLKPLQLLVYAKAIKQKYSDAKNILGSFIMIKHNFEEKSIAIDDDAIDGAIKKIESVAEMINTDKVWQKKPSVLCNWCDYKDECFNSWV